MASTEAGAGRPCVKEREGVSGMTEAPAPRSLPLVFPAGALFPRGFSQSALCGGGGGMLREADCSLASAGNSGHRIWPDRPEESCPLRFLVAPEGPPGCLLGVGGGRTVRIPLGPCFRCLAVVLWFIPGKDPERAAPRLCPDLRYEPRRPRSPPHCSLSAHPTARAQA